MDVVQGFVQAAPTSSILSEIYMHFMENTKIYNILWNSNVEGYFRYVDDILIVYKDNITDIVEVLSSFNNINPRLRFTLEREQNDKLNFLDLTIMKGANKLTYEIFRKPTTSNTIIPKDSCHPLEHKLAAVRYFVNSIRTYNLDHPQKQKS
jgi:hypothetical protein